MPDARPPAAARVRRLALTLLALAVGGAAWLLDPSAALVGVRWLVARGYPDVPRVDAATLARALQGADGTVTLLDARAPEEFAVSHLRGARRIDPRRPDLTLPGVDRSRPIVVYCSVGYRSARVVRALRAAGLPDVRNLDGGIFAWFNEGRPVFRGARVVGEVHPYDALWGRLLHNARRAPAPPS